MRLKDIIIGFISNLGAVILGIIITFAVQGRIDRRQDRREVESALRLVRSELAANRDDIGQMKDFLVEEQRSAAYFLENRSNPGACPDDSVIYHSGILFADAYITLSYDALELLKMSSLFQKIGDNDLSMKIIRAYNTCSIISSALNRHIEERDDRFRSLMEDRYSARMDLDGVIRAADLLLSDYGIYSIRMLAGGSGTDGITDVADIDAAVDALDAALSRKKHK